jgi:hypothetical protein
MMLLAIPPAILPQVKTIGSKALPRRVTMACSADFFSAHANHLGSPIKQKYLPRSAAQSGTLFAGFRA